MPNFLLRLLCLRLPALLPAFLTVLLAGVLSGCGGGGDGGGDATPGPSSNDGVPRIEPYERTSSMSLVQRRSLAASPSVPSVVPARVELGPLPAVVPPSDTVLRSGARREIIGAPRDVTAAVAPADLSALLSWQPTASGGRAAAITFRSDEAAGLRLGLRIEQLPAQAVLRVFGLEGEPVRLTAGAVQDSLARDALSRPASPSAAGAPLPLYWTPTVAGQEATLQIELPAEVDPAAVVLAIPRLSHLWRTRAAMRMAPGLGDALGECHIDAQCESQYTFEARAVAYLEYVDDSDQKARSCTGTLMADTVVSGTPYFLTAHHCIDSQAEASTAQTYWFYRPISCNSTVLDPAATALMGGATLLHTAADSDVTFLRLLDRPPVGAAHAGSLVGQPAINVTVGALHHPGGDWLKFSEGTVAAYGSCSESGGVVRCGPNSDARNNYVGVRWSRGVTEAGSSGSAIFATVGAQHYVVGHLYAGNSSCTNLTAPDYYGRMDRAYPALRQWLGDVPGT